MKALKIFIISCGQSAVSPGKISFFFKIRLVIFRKKVSLYGQEEDKFNRISNVECPAEGGTVPPLHVMMNVQTLAQPLEC